MNDRGLLPESTIKQRYIVSASAIEQRNLLSESAIEQKNLLSESDGEQTEVLSEPAIDQKKESASMPIKNKKIFPEHQPKAEGEVINTFIPKGVRNIILDYLNNDIKPIASNGKGTAKQYDQFKIFGRSLEYFVNCDQLPHAANLILQGDDKSIAAVLTLINANPFLLHIPTEGIDPLNRRVKGKLIEIAAMAGDINLKIHDRNHSGLVALLAFAGGLSQEEVREQLEVITGEEAKQINKNRNLLILKAMDQFTDALLKVKPCDDFREFKNSCLPVLNQLKNNLQSITSQTITSGFVFDPDVISQVATKFESRITSFGGWFSVYSGVFWVYGFGTLQKQLCARDAQVVRSGLKNFLEKHLIPPRIPSSPSDSEGAYYLDYNGNKNTAEKCQFIAPCNTQDMQAYGLLAARKKKSIENHESTNNKSYLKSLFRW